MKKILISAVLAFTISNVSAQIKQRVKYDTTITWYSVPHYDSVGNEYHKYKTFHHAPTTKDSLDFGPVLYTKDSFKKKRDRINTIIGFGFFIIGSVALLSK
jgi:hypothetical protein